MSHTTKIRIETDEMYPVFSAKKDGRSKLEIPTVILDFINQTEEQYYLAQKCLSALDDGDIEQINTVVEEILGYEGKL